MLDLPSGSGAHVTAAVEPRRQLGGRWRLDLTLAAQRSHSRASLNLRGQYPRARDSNTLRKLSGGWCSPLALLVGERAQTQRGGAPGDLLSLIPSRDGASPRVPGDWEERAPGALGRACDGGRVLSWVHHAPLYVRGRWLGDCFPESGLSEKAPHQISARH
jgi:hypothetical protein